MLKNFNTQSLTFSNFRKSHFHTQFLTFEIFCNFKGIYPQKIQKISKSRLCIKIFA